MSWTTLSFQYESILTAVKLGQLQANIGLLRGAGNQIIYDTAGTYTYEPTSGIKSVRVVVIGAGGGGASGQDDPQDFVCSGGGGGCAIKWITADLLDSAITVTVGEGGAAGTGNGGVDGIGEDGGTSSFGSHCSATGGEGGPPEDSRTNGGVGVGGAINLRGQGNFAIDDTYQAGGSAAGICSGSIFGQNADSPGAGGVGGKFNRPSATSPFDGADGLVLIEEYF